MDLQERNDGSQCLLLFIYFYFAKDHLMFHKSQVGRGSLKSLVMS